MTLILALLFFFVDGDLNVQFLVYFIFFWGVDVKYERENIGINDDLTKTTNINLLLSLIEN